MKIGHHDRSSHASVMYLRGILYFLCNQFVILNRVPDLLLGIGIPFTILCLQQGPVSVSIYINFAHIWQVCVVNIGEVMAGRVSIFCVNIVC